ncbi:MAG TPA: N-acetyltransferase [Flavobacteriaceae bacterium]|jgi:hypothetical protein|nr:N-acetyltransferase [Flavobacteriaceae bacterium]|tara:strand:+ start:89914 stop:90189 length:276 start_codon:yes stop_codon:yes gene_type:complete
MDFKILDNKEEKRFEAHIEGETAFVEYERGINKIIITHTEVPKELEGKGVGSTLVKQVLKKIEEKELKVEPKCSFVAGYIERHSEFKNLLA